MEAKNSCLILIRQLQHTLEKKLNSVLQDMDITMTQAAALAAVLECPDKQIALKQLEKNLHLAQSVTAGIVSRLEQKKFLESFGDSTDKRIKLVRITPAGEQACHSAQKVMMGIEKNFLSNFTKDEYATFHNLLKKATESMKA